MSADATPVNADALVRDRVRCVGGARGGRARVCARARCVAVARVSFVCVVRVPLSSCRAAAAPRHATPSRGRLRRLLSSVVGRRARRRRAAAVGGDTFRFWFWRARVVWLAGGRGCRLARAPRASCRSRRRAHQAAKSGGRLRAVAVAALAVSLRRSALPFLRARLWHGRVSRPLPCRARACVRTRAVPARAVSWRALLLAPRRFLAQQQSFVARNRFTNFCLWSARWRRRFWRFEPDDVARCCVLS